MADGNVPALNLSPEPDKDPSSKGVVASTTKAIDPKQKRKQIQEEYADGKQFQVFESAIAGIEADAQQKGGLTNADIAIIRNLQREMLTIGKKFSKRNTDARKNALDAGARDPGLENVKKWDRIAKGIESTLALNPGFDEFSSEYQKASNGYKKNLLLQANRAIAKDAERAANQAGSTSADRERARQEQLLLQRGEAFIRKPVYAERLTETAPSSTTTESTNLNTKRVERAVDTATTTTAEPSPSPSSEESTPANTQESSGAQATVTSPISSRVTRTITTTIRAPANDQAEAEVAERQISSEKLESILKDLDDQQDALNEQLSEAHKKRADGKISVEDFKMMAEVQQKHLAIEQKRLELFQQNKGVLPGVYQSFYDQKTLEQNIKQAQDGVDETKLGLTLRQYETTYPEADAKTLATLIRSLNDARFSAVTVRAGAKVKADLDEKIASLRKQIDDFQVQHPLDQPPASIAQTRSVLRETFAEKKQDKLYLETYNERTRAYAVEYLQTHAPEMFTRYQALQQTTTVDIDPSIFLTKPQRAEIEVRIVADLKAAHPEITEAKIASLVLAQADLLLTGIAANENGKAATLITLANLTGQAGIKVGSVTTHTAPMAVGLLNEALDTRNRLQNEEQQIVARTQTIKQLIQNAPSDPTGKYALASAQGEQQRAFSRRRDLQSALHAQVAGFTALQAATFDDQKKIDGVRQTEPAILIAGFLMQVGHQPAAFVQPAANDTSAPVSKNVIAQAPTISSADQARETAYNTDKETHENTIASRLASNQLRDRHLEQTAKSAGGGSSPSQGNFGADETPLLAIAVKPKTKNEQFAQVQREMVVRATMLSGNGSPESGFENAFSDAPSGTTYQESPYEDAPYIDEEDIEMEDPEALDQERQAEFQKQQHAARAEEAQQQSMQQKAENVQNLAKSPQGQKALASVAKLAANPATIILLIIVVAIWLNIRLIASKEGSMLRKPLTALGKLGTIVLDIALMLILMMMLAFIVIDVIIFFLPILLPLGGVFAILQGAIHLFGG